MNMQDLLGRMMQGSMTPSSNDRLTNAVAAQPGDDKHGLSGMFGAWAESMKSGVGGQQMLDTLSGTAKDMFSQTKAGVQGGNPLAIGGLAALAGAIFSGGGAALRGAAGAGALAVLAKVAYDAMQGKAQDPAAQATTSAQAPSAEPPLGLRPAKTTEEEATLERRAGLAVRSMIAAAKADGRIDEQERSAIVGKVKATGATADALRYISDRMNEPTDMQALIADAHGKEEALQVYAASLLAIEADTDEERTYLHRLAQGLHLDQSDLDLIHRSMGIPSTRGTDHEVFA